MYLKNSANDAGRGFKQTNNNNKRRIGDAGGIPLRKTYPNGCYFNCMAIFVIS